MAYSGKCFVRMFSNASLNFDFNERLEKLSSNTSFIVTTFSSLISGLTNSLIVFHSLQAAKTTIVATARSATINIKNTFLFILLSFFSKNELRVKFIYNYLYFICKFMIYVYL